jgi:UDP-glucose 4-epimerase
MTTGTTYGGAFAGRRVLITGGAGFIGSHLGAKLAELGAHVVVLDDLSGGHESNLAPGTRLVKASILDDDALEDATAGCAYVFHQAAMVSVPQSVEQPERCIAINVDGTRRVLEAAKRAGVARVMFAASAAAYGNTPSLPSKESDPPDCWSPYAASKVAGELLLQTWARCFGLSTISLRYFNIFGPRQDPKSPYAAVISAFADALAEGRTPRIMGDGEQTRDFTPVANVVHANLLAASCMKPLAGEVVNIGCATRIRLLDVLARMGEVLGVDATPSFAPPRAGDVRHSSADITRAKDLLGYAPVMDFATGIRLTLEWAASQRGTTGHGSTR